MSKYQELTQGLSTTLGKLNKENPNLMSNFHNLSKHATKSGALDEKTKELMALSIGIAKQCDGCIGFHTQKLVKLGVTQEEFLEMLDIAVYMGGGPALMYAASAYDAYQEFAQ